MSAFFEQVFQNIMKIASSVRWNDILDIFLVTMVLFYLFRLCRQTRALHLVKGLVFLAVIYFIVAALKLNTSGYLFRSFFGDIVIVLVILFQNELRHAIEVFGRGDFKKFSLFSSKESHAAKQQLHSSASFVAKAAANMSENRVGALIVFEGKSPLGEIIQTGSRVDAAISVPVIENIFYPKAPLHDGAMIIRDNRIHSAGCILPLTQKNISRELGTRHRAALGMSEHYDALIVVVSEETGCISVAQNSQMVRDLTPAQLLDRLTDFLIPKENEKSISKARRRKNNNEK